MINEGQYGSRNIAFPYFIRYAIDFTADKLPQFAALQLESQIVIMGYALNLITGALGVVAFAVLSRRVLRLYLLADVATILFMIMTPLWTVDPLCPFALISTLREWCNSFVSLF